jgi:hypothetical protein
LSSQIPAADQCHSARPRSQNAKTILEQRLNRDRSRNPHFDDSRDSIYD